MLIVNIFGGPGSGKSSTAAALYALLKSAGYRCELCMEVAKDLTWDGVPAKKFYQPMLVGNQAWRIERLRSHNAEVVVTDSPVLLSLAYSNHDLPDAWTDYVGWEHGRDPSVNIMLKRVKAYEKFGRSQTAEEAIDLDHKIAGILADHEVTPDGTLDGDGSAPAKAFALVVAALTRIDAQVAQNEVIDQMMAREAQVNAHKARTSVALDMQAHFPPAVPDARYDPRPCGWQETAGKLGEALGFRVPVPTSDDCNPIRAVWADPSEWRGTGSPRS